MRIISAILFGTFLPIDLPSLNRTAHPRRASTNETSIVVDQNCLGTCNDDGYTVLYTQTFPGLMGESCLESARCFEERLGEWFCAMLEVRLP